MRAFLEIVKVELLGALRSRIVLLLSVASAAWVLLGPSILKYDGSDDGTFFLSVRYLLGLVFSVMIVFLGAFSASAISADRTAKRLQLVLIRPVRHSVIALARIAAIVSIGASVMALSCLLLYLTAGKGRTCERVYSPVLENPRIGAQRIFDDCMKNDKAFKERVSEIGVREVMKYLEGYVRDTYQSIAPGKSAKWDFSSVPETERPMSVRIKLNDLFGRTGSVIGDFTFSKYSGKLENINKTLIKVPLGVSGGPAEGKDLVFVNRTDSTVSLQPQRDLHILVRADGFGWNVFRAWIQMTAILAIVVSMGIFFGAALSRSVAVFALMSMLVAMVISPTTIEEYPNPIESNRIDRLGLLMTEFSANATSSLNRYNPITRLESDECILWADVGMAVGTASLYIVFLSLLSGFAMSRKISL